jgi:hypothetical protein
LQNPLGRTDDKAAKPMSRNQSLPAKPDSTLSKKVFWFFFAKKNRFLLSSV